MSVSDVKTPVGQPGGWIIRIFDILMSFEAIFILFVFAGLLKGDPRFSSLPVDLTVLLGSLVVVGASWLVIGQQISWRVSTLKVAYLGSAFFVYMAATLLWSPAPQEAMYKFQFMIPLVALSFLVSILVIARDAKRIERFLSLLVLFASWVMIETLIAYGTRTSGMSLSVLSGGYISIGRLLGLAWLIVYVDLVTRARGSFVTVSQVLLLIGYSFGLVVVGSRQTLIATVAAALIPLIYSQPFSLRPGFSGVRMRLVAVSGLLVVIIGIWSLQIAGIEMNTLDRMAVLLSGRSTDVRLDQGTYVLETWGNRPGFGHGLVAFGHMYGITPAYRGYPHNIILEILMEGGLVGVLLFMYLVWLCLKQYRFSRRRIVVQAMNGFDSSTVLLLAAFSGISVMVSSTYAEERSFFALLGLLCMQCVHDTSVRKVDTLQDGQKCN